MTSKENAKKVADFKPKAVGKLSVYSARAQHYNPENDEKLLRGEKITHPAVAFAEEWTERSASQDAKFREHLVQAVMGPQQQSVGLAIQTPSEGKPEAPRRGL